MEIKVLGTGCPRCKKLEEVARQAIAENGADVQVSKVTDIKDIMAYGIASTPALVVDGKVKVSGRIPRKEEIVIWIKEAAATA